MTESDPTRPSKADTYSEYWGYLRHIETTRFQMTSLIAVVVGGALGALIGTAPWGTGSGLTRAEGTAVVFGLVLFVAFGGHYLIGHKINYHWYFKRLTAIDPGLDDDSRPTPMVFGWLMAMLGLIQGALALTVVVLAGGVWAWITAVAAALVIASWWWRWRSGVGG